MFSPDPIDSVREVNVLVFFPGVMSCTEGRGRNEIKVDVKNRHRFLV